MCRTASGKPVSPTDEKGRAVVLGRVSGVYGVSGWVKLHSYTEPRTAILNYQECWLRNDHGEQETQLLEGRAQGKGVVARFAGIEDRDAAANLIDQEILVSRSTLPGLSDGHFYWADLEGLTVERLDGALIGKVAYLIATGSNDVLVVQGDKETLVPFLWGSVVTDVDLEAGRIRVDWEWE